MTLQDQLVVAGLVSDEHARNLRESEQALADALSTLRHANCVYRRSIAMMLPEELAQYHAELKRHRLYVVRVDKYFVRFAQRPQRSYIAFCYAARRRFDKKQARKARQ